MYELENISGTLTATPVAVESGKYSCSIRDGLLCSVVLAACVLIANPTANMPFMDDFSYTKTALDFERTGHFLYNGWAVEILGWLVPWGALFIKLFGFSFTVMRLSMLPIAMAAVFLFHQILRRFGVNRQNAVLGALTMSLSPLFLPLAASFMNDVPGLFVILLCIYMCQRAVAAKSDSAALLWLIFAMVLNVGGGTVRQIAWLGSLVMVPSTAWLMRERRGMKIAGVLLFGCSLIGILACLHWFNEQPYSVPEHVFVRPIQVKMLVHLAAQLLKTFLCLLLVIFPVTVAWLPTAHRLNRQARLRVAGAMVLLALLAIILNRAGVIDGWVMPWLNPLLAEQWNLMPGMQSVTPVAVTIIRIAISLLVIAPALTLLEQVAIQKRNKLDSFIKPSSLWKELAWILGPFSLSYVLLLAPRGTFDIIYDRYVLGMVPTAIIIMLKLYQEKSSMKLSTVSLATLFVFTVFSIGGTHDYFAELRAIVTTIQMVQSSAVPEKSIQAGLTRLGWTHDGWTQIQNGGHINDSRIQIPYGAYIPYIPDLNIPPGCRSWFASSTPTINPKYFVTSSSLSCFAGSKYPPVHYTAWLPPFHRALYVQKLRNSSN